MKIDRNLIYVLLSAMFVSLQGCAHAENTVLAERPSPDGLAKVVIFNRGSSHSDASTQMSLLAANESLSDTSGNLFLAQSGQPLALDSELKVVWTAADALTITYKHDRQILRHKRELSVPVAGDQERTVHITYERM